MSWPGATIEALKNSSIVAALTIISLVILITPDGCSPKLAELRTQYQPWPLLAFTFFLIILVADYLRHTRPTRRANRARRRARHEHEDRVYERMLSLDPHEMLLLREFIIQGRNAIPMPTNNPVVAGLHRAGVLNRVPTAPDIIGESIVHVYELSTVARPFINPKKLGVPSDPTPPQKQRILAERPYYMIEVDRHTRLWRS